MKGPVETYLEQGGNDADTASLLVEMLRAKGVPARYVRGAAVLPAATLQKITVRRRRSRACVFSIARAYRTTLPSWAVARSLPSAWSASGSKRTCRTPTTEGRRSMPKATLDPARSRVQAAPDAAEPRRGAGAGLRRAVQPRCLSGGPNEQDTLRARARPRDGIARSTAPDVAYADVLNNRDHVAENLGILPPTTPYAATPIEVFYSLPDSLRHTVRIVGERQARRAGCDPAVGRSPGPPPDLSYVPRPRRTTTWRTRTAGSCGLRPTSSR